MHAPPGSGSTKCVVGNDSALGDANPRPPENNTVTGNARIDWDQRGYYSSASIYNQSHHPPSQIQSGCHPAGSVQFGAAADRSARRFGARTSSQAGVIADILLGFISRQFAAITSGAVQEVAPAAVVRLKSLNHGPGQIPEHMILFVILSSNFPQFSLLCRMLSDCSTARR